jgi:molybdate transport system substrate-binding protein
MRRGDATEVSVRAALIVVLVILVVVGGVSAWRAQTQGPGLAEGSSKETLGLALPMGLYLPVSEIMARFEEEHPGVECDTWMVDTPEAMVQAVEANKDKPDIFLSPGGHEAVVLRDRGFIDPDTMVAFGSYELAVLVPRDNPGGIERVEDLLKPEVKVISFSDPDVNAACYAARQSLQNLGLWEKLEPKIKVTGCCMESFKWIVDGRAEANIQFLGCPLDPKTAEMAEGSKVKIACAFPADTFYVPRNVAGIVTTTKKRELAAEFLSFMTSASNIELMAENRMRNDRGLPLTPGPWGEAQEAGPEVSAS